MNVVREVFAIGLEARFVPGQRRPVDGTPVTIPPGWSIVSVFAGTEGGNVCMYSALTGINTRACSFASAKRAVDRVEQLYPIDGDDLNVDNGRVISRADPHNANRLRRWRMWVPPRDVLIGGDQVVQGQITGMGVGLEFRDGLGYLAPYYAVCVLEEKPNNSDKNAPGLIAAPIVVPVRLFEPFDPRSRPDKDGSVRETIPALFRGMRERGDIGDSVVCRVTATPTPHYYCEDVYRDTALGHAFQEANVRRADLAAGAEAEA